jgi:hypothetical protein
MRPSARLRRCRKSMSSEPSKYAWPARFDLTALRDGAPIKTQMLNTQEARTTLRVTLTLESGTGGAGLRPATSTRTPFTGWLADHFRIALIYKDFLTVWRWGQSSANSSLSRLFPVLRENTGKFVEFRLGRRLTSAFAVEIQSLTSRIP